MKYLTNYVPQGGGTSGYVAVEENGELKLQKLSFNGTEATPDGATEAMLEVGLFPTGMDEPAYAGSGGGGGSVMKFYQCTAVDTATKTWSGKELVLTDGVYVVSETETTGLVYGTGFTPVVGTIYDENALFVISNLFTPADYLDGCVFAANMQSTSAMYNGETVNLEGATLADAPGYSDGTQALTSSIEFALDGVNDFADGNATVCLSAYFATSASDSQDFMRMYGSDGTDWCYVRQQYSAGTMYSKIRWQMSFNFVGNYDPGTFGWHHIAVQNSGNEFGKLYVDGVLVSADSSSSGYDSVAQLQSVVKYVISLSGAYMKDLQVYNRVLDENEIADLYSKAKLPATA